MDSIKIFTFELRRRPAYHPSASGCKLSHSPEEETDVKHSGQQVRKLLKRN